MSVSNEPQELGMENLVPTYHASVNTEYEELNFLAYKLTAIERPCEVGPIGYVGGGGGGHFGYFHSIKSSQITTWGNPSDS
jgi:hypothetical protein